MLTQYLTMFFFFCHMKYMGCIDTGKEFYKHSRADRFFWETTSWYSLIFKS